MTKYKTSAARGFLLMGASIREVSFITGIGYAQVGLILNSLIRENKLTSFY